MCYHLTLSYSHLAPPHYSVSFSHYALVSISSYLTVSSVLSCSPTPTPGHVQAAGHVQSTPSLCSELFQMTLAVPSFICTIKTFPNNGAVMVVVYFILIF